VLVYLPTKLGHLWGKCWDSYSSTMDPMGMEHVGKSYDDEIPIDEIDDFYGVYLDFRKSPWSNLGQTWFKLLKSGYDSVVIYLAATGYCTWDKTKMQHLTAVN